MKNNSGHRPDAYDERYVGMVNEARGRDILLLAFFGDVSYLATDHR